VHSHEKEDHEDPRRPGERLPDPRIEWPTLEERPNGGGEVGERPLLEIKSLIDETVAILGRISRSLREPETICALNRM